LKKSKTKKAIPVDDSEPIGTKLKKIKAKKAEKEAEDNVKEAA
jgi:hypothetical protein